MKEVAPYLVVGAAVALPTLLAKASADERTLADLAARELKRIDELNEIADAGHKECLSLFATHEPAWWEAFGWARDKCPPGASAEQCDEARRYAACVESRDRVETRQWLDGLRDELDNGNPVIDAAVKVTLLPFNLGLAGTEFLLGKAADVAKAAASAAGGKLVLMGAVALGGFLVYRKVMT